MITRWLDLPQVDLMNFRVEFVRPRSGRFWGSERRSRERSTCLAWRVFVFVLRQKWGVAWLVTDVSGYLVNWMAKIIGSAPTKTIERVCVSKSSKEQICLLCTEVITEPGLGGGGGYSQKNWVGVCGPLPKNPTLFMTKICDIPYPIYDLTKNSKPYLWPVSVVRYNSSLVQTNVKLL